MFSYRYVITSLLFSRIGRRIPALQPSPDEFIASPMKSLLVRPSCLLLLYTSAELRHVANVVLDCQVYRLSNVHYVTLFCVHEYLFYVCCFCRYVTTSLLVLFTSEEVTPLYRRHLGITTIFHKLLRPSPEPFFDS